MTDEHFDHLIEQAQGLYRPPPQAPLDEIWAGLERRRGRPSWYRRSVLPVSIAAALALSFTLGRLTGSPQPAAAPAAQSIAAATERPIDETTVLLLGETAVLLMALPEPRATEGGGQARFVAQARDLLVTTRLLMDSRASSNPRLRDLLQDLELTLAQIARLQGAPTRDELKLIADVVEQQDIVPRIRSMAAGLPAGDN